MYIKTLNAEDFRNYKNISISLSSGTNVFFGNNAQGKTNLLEACNLFSSGRSHRAKSDTEMIRFGADLFTLKCDFADSERDYSAIFRINSEGKKLIKINNIAITRLSMLMSYLNVVMFSPDDLRLIKGSPSIRRKFTDEAISQLYPNYLVKLINYNKALQQKNALLKSLRLSGVRHDSTLSVWNEQLSDYGAAICSYRRNFFEKLESEASAVHKELAGEELSLSYQPNIVPDTENVRESIFKKLEASQEREIDMGLSQYGIQRDDFRVTVNNREARIFGSQGQQRSCVLTLKLAEAEYIKNIKGEYPVLLLDDIMSELDIKRRGYLAEKIHEKQVLITCTDIDALGKDSETRLFKISAGKVDVLT